MKAGKRIKLDDRAVNALKPPKQGNTIVWDTIEPGFGVRVSDTGRKSFLVNYRADGKQRQVTIGRYGSWSVNEARKHAVKIRDDARFDGVDYLEEMRAESAKRIEKDELTLHVALEHMLADRSDLRERSVTSYKNPVERYLWDWLDRPLCDITGNDVRLRFKEIQNGQNLDHRKDRGKFAAKDKDGQGYRRLRGGPASAKATMVALRAIWQHARWNHQDQFDLGDSPTTRLPKGWNRVVVKTTTLPDDKLNAFIDACNIYTDASQGDLARFLLFTGLRLNEAAQLRWAEIDLGSGLLQISAERMKGKEDLRIPLNKFAMDILDKRHNQNCDADGFVFPGKRSHATVTNKLKCHIAEHAGTHTTAHDWRRTYTTIALGAGVPLQTVEALTGALSEQIGLSRGGTFRSLRRCTIPSVISTARPK